MFKTQVGLGVLQLPKAFSILGLIPGLISLWSLAVIALWLGYQIGKAGRQHPNIRSLAHVGQVTLGRVGAEVFGAAYFLCKSGTELSSYRNSTDHAQYRLPVRWCLRYQQH